MLLMLCLSCLPCLAAAKKLGHQVSLSLECKGLHGKMEHLRKPILPKYSIKFVHLPQHDPDTDIGALFLDPTYCGAGFEKDLEALVDIYKIADVTQFKIGIQLLCDLINYKKHDKTGNYSAAYKNSHKDAFLDPVDSQDIYKALDYKATVGRLVMTANTTHTTGPEGLTLRSRVEDEAVFESTDKIKIVIGPRQNFGPDQPFETFKLASSVDDLNLSADFLARAGIVAGASGYKKDLEIIVVGAPGITEADIRKKVDAIVQGEDYATRLQATHPNEVNVATMGGVGISAAYHYHTRNFIFTMRSGLDYIWGKFCQTLPQGANTEINPSLGCGGYVGIGADYKWTGNVALGLEGGVRLNQLKIPLTKEPTKKASTWFWTPYAQVNCTFFGDEDTSLGLFSGYIFAKEFVITSTGSRIPYGSPCKIGGLYGGLRVSKYF